MRAFPEDQGPQDKVASFFLFGLLCRPQRAGVVCSAHTVPRVPGIALALNRRSVKQYLTS